MRAIPYSDVLQKAAEASGRIFVDLSREEAGLLRGFIGTRLKQIWEKWLWPDLMMSEERKFRAEWSGGTTYAAGAEVAYTPARKYYQSLRGSNTNHAPATGATFVENSAWWAESDRSYSGANYDAAKAYAVGDRVYYPPTDRWYQAHTAGTGNLPTNTSFWGVLTPLVRYVAYEQSGFTKLGDVIEVWDKDPEVFEGALGVPWREAARGIEVFQSLFSVWPQWRKLSPFLKGNLFIAATAYAVGEQVYYRQTLTSGNVVADFYDCIAATTNEAPTDTTKWAKVEIPFVFGEFLSHAAAADLLSKDGKDDWSGDEMALAQEMLLHELDKQQRQKGQEPALQVMQRQAVC